jgi:hypothetical protein
MSRLTAVTALTGLVLLATIIELLRRRQLREKYALLWLGVAIVVLPLAAFPRLLDRVAGLLGVASGVSLVLFLGVVFLLLVAVHLSWEVSRLEEETRILAEEIALLRTEPVEPLRRMEPAQPTDPTRRDPARRAGADWPGPPTARSSAESDDALPKPDGGGR